MKFTKKVNFSLTQFFCMSLIVAMLWTPIAFAQSDEMTGNPIGEPSYICQTYSFACIFNEAIDFYSDGSLVNATSVETSCNLLKLFSSNESQWSTSSLKGLIERVATSLRAEYPDSERLQIGDIANLHGGLIPPHLSHQNGLDADIAYLRRDRREQFADSEWFDESFVFAEKVSANFDTQRNWWLLAEFVASESLGRIFVDQIIKDHMCAFAAVNGISEQEAMVLRRLRPYPGHADHFHIRLICPKSSLDCREQSPPPEGTGCASIQNKLPITSKQRRGGA